MKSILLIEPPYRNKYPPIGLMKLATYHKMLGDEITFFKGNVSELVLELAVEDILNFYKNSIFIAPKIKVFIKDYIKSGKSDILENLLSPIDDQELQYNLIKKLNIYRSAKRQKRLGEIFYWDRIYITTLFTFYWDITIKCIEDAKQYIHDDGDIKIGGVMASLLNKEIENEVGIKPNDGLLDKPGQLDDNQIIIDDLVPDYLILDQIEYDYPSKNAYITFMTKGCTRTCSFCSVPKIEPTYREYVPTIAKMEYIKDNFGEKCNLLLMDNNVLASPKFPQIIDEIKEMGFYKGAKYKPVNNFEVYYKTLLEKEDPHILISLYKSIKDVSIRIEKVASEKNKEKFKLTLRENSLLNINSFSKDGLINAYKIISPMIEQYRNKASRNRYVDFNQGTDARYVTDEIMKKMSEIPIRPLRIAFDYIGMKKEYTKAVKLAAKYGITELSNYLLYNFNDKPIDLWERMKINIDLSNDFDLKIFSFPMKYIPLFGEEAKGRQYIGKNWNKHFIRNIQIILNVTKGIVASGDKFFNRAFGANPEIFSSILHMPEQYVMYRDAYEKSGLIKVWNEQYLALNNENKDKVSNIIKNYEYKNLKIDDFDDDHKDFMSHYILNNEHQVFKQNDSYSIVRDRYQQLIKKDVFLDMTLTYDYDNSHLNDLGKELLFNVK